MAHIVGNTIVNFYSCGDGEGQEDNESNTRPTRLLVQANKVRRSQQRSSRVGTRDTQQRIALNRADY